ncbi:hypothetical protein H0H92_013377 [Tricholoma furcatifolium]|nr:hypothetical protein H0H92_013377 [Tricholoma furcatifolium]
MASFAIDSQIFGRKDFDYGQEDFVALDGPLELLRPDSQIRLRDFRRQSFQTLTARQSNSTQGFPEIVLSNSYGQFRNRHSN